MAQGLNTVEGRALWARPPHQYRFFTPNQGAGNRVNYSAESTSRLGDPRCDTVGVVGHPTGSQLDDVCF